MQDYLTTKELAALLRIKERKVYDLAASGKVPCSKATGKLLFPRAEVEAWIADNQSGSRSAAPVSAVRRGTLPNVVLGSHDPLLDWALRESRSGLATYFDGSLDGLRRLEAGEGIAAGFHLYNAATRDWNTPQLLGPTANLPVVAIEWARRRRGLIAAPERARKIKGLADLNGVPFAARQPDAGAQVLFEALLVDAGLSADRVTEATVARSESDAVLAVSEGRAEACFGLETLAVQHKLGFVPVIEERFDLVVDRRSWFEPPMQALLAFCQSDTFRQRADALAGYDIGNFGRVRFNGG